MWTHLSLRFSRQHCEVRNQVKFLICFFYMLIYGKVRFTSQHKCVRLNGQARFDCGLSSGPCNRCATSRNVFKHRIKGSSGFSSYTSQFQASGLFVTHKIFLWLIHGKCYLELIKNKNYFGDVMTAGPASAPISPLWWRIRLFVYTF